MNTARPTLGRALRRLLLASLLVIGAGVILPFASTIRAQDAPADETAARAPTVLQLAFDGPIGPAFREYVHAGLGDAIERDAGALVLRLDTPGGLVGTMREVIKEMLASPVPVIVFVAPSGSRAASAGTYLLYASHVAAMAPGTNLGAATPVPMSGEWPDPESPGNPGPGDRFEEAPPASDTPSPPGEPDDGMGTMERKVTNDAVAYIRSLAALRGRNADWAEAAVREAKTLTAEAALADDVIDVVATDTPDLLEQIEGRGVTVAGERRVLELANARIVDYPASWRIELLSVITDPNIALVLLAIGCVGLLFEFLSPGALLPGTVGAVSLLLALYSLSLLPLSATGIGLLLLGFALIVAEAFVPSFGVLGIGGVVSLGLAASILMQEDAPGFELALPLVIGIGIVSLALVILIVRLAVKSSRRRVVTGIEGIIGRTGTVIDWSDGEGHVFADGERWHAVSDGTADERFHVDGNVTVIRVDSTVLTVTPDESSAGDRSAGASSAGEWSAKYPHEPIDQSNRT